MNPKLIHTISQMNTDFYRAVSDSFSATRQSPWNGWKQLGIFFEEYHHSSSLKILDIACGNLRFEEFLTSALPSKNLAFTCIDNCESLLPKNYAQNISFHQTDVMYALEHQKALLAEDKRFDISVSFGFMHHIPTQEMRLTLLNLLIEHTKPGGLVVVSFWQFANLETMKTKALKTTKKALQQLRKTVEITDLDENDYFLGWKDTEGIYRYCHHFSDEELTLLAKSVLDRATLIKRFLADGRNNQLNAYLVFKKK